jgi:D-alanyl-D-alanine-carboxypeptidase/D-alanyl-D-alanine-endopeptidase
MNIGKSVRVIYTTLILYSIPAPGIAEDITNALRSFLQERVTVERSAAIVVGLVDESGSRVVSCGKLNGQEVDGDKPFGIGSITKTFTALLLQDVVERDEMKLDDPVTKYLPASVKVPIRNGKEITLLQLAIHTSGLPANPGNLDPKGGFAHYTTDQLYTFLSGYKLRRDPGTQYHYSNLGVSLLGHVIALNAGTNYESLVTNRICRPLKMDSTRVDGNGHSAALAAQGAIVSTANDLLKYVAAYAGLTRTSLTPLFQRASVVHTLPGAPDQNTGSWLVASDPQGRKFVLHDGDSGSYSAFAGFDQRRRRGVVVLSSSLGSEIVVGLSRLLLESEWQLDKRPKEAKISQQIYDLYVGQYLRSAATNATSPPPGIGIRREGKRLIAQATGPRSWPIRALLPGVEGELLAESESRLFGKLSGIPITFSRNAQEGVTGLTVQFGGEAFYYRKVSNHPPKAPEPPKPLVAVKLGTKLLDACVGQYEFSTNGMKLTLRREGDHLVSQAWIEDDTDGYIDVYPESETKFFDNYGNRWSFVRNHKGEVTLVVLQGANFPNWEGKKVSNSPR